MEAGKRFQAGKRFPRTYRSKGASEYRYVAAQEEEPIKVEDEVQTLILATEIKDKREAGELTQVKGEAEVDVKMMDEGEAGEQVTHDEMKDEMDEMAGEQATHDEMKDEMKDEMNEMAGERATQLRDEVELKAGEQTQLREFEVKVVDDELSAGEQTQSRDGMVLGAGEQTHGGVAQDSCSGSVLGAV